MKIIRNAFLSLSALLLPLVIFAEKRTGPPEANEFINPIKFKTIGEFLNALLDIIIMVAIPLLVLFLTYAGFLFVTAQGEPEKLSTAKRVFLWTIVGALLILGAKVLSTAIQGTVNQLKAEVHYELYAHR